MRPISDLDDRLGDLALRKILRNKKEFVQVPRVAEQRRR